jgi:hypothetical protein
MTLCGSVGCFVDAVGAMHRYMPLQQSEDQARKAAAEAVEKSEADCEKVQC